MSNDKVQATFYPGGHPTTFECIEGDHDQCGGLAQVALSGAVTFCLCPCHEGAEP